MSRQEYQDMYDAIGVAMEVHTTLGRGLAEPIYQEAFAIEMGLRGLQVEREKALKLQYKNVMMEKIYVADFYYKGIVIEFKSVEELCSDHRAQLFNYMRMAKETRGLLFNFGERNLHTERYLYIPEVDDFLLLTRDNYTSYISD
jgi:GxxExxY protein